MNLMQKKPSYKIIREDILCFTKDTEIGFKSLAGKTLLLTGANGFIPGYIADSVVILNDEVLEEPCKLIAITHNPVTVNDRLGHLIHRKDIIFKTADVGHSFDIPEGVSFFIHAASPASPKYYMDKPIETMDANVVGLRTILDYSLKNSVKSILFLSAGAVYGDPPPEHIPTKEDFNGNPPFTSGRACYSESKRYSETLGHEFHRIYGTPFKSVRIYHNYGPGLKLNDGRLIADFMADLIAKRDLQIKSDGSAKLNYCYVSDTVEACWRVLLSKYDGHAFNVASDTPSISVLELAQKISKLSEPSLKIIHSQSEKNVYLKGGLKIHIPDISKIKQLTGWKERMDMDEGLKRTYDWYKLEGGIL